MKKVFFTLLTALGTTAMAQVPTNGMTAWYPMDGNANDTSGNNYHGATVTATLTTDRFGNPGGAYHFDGTQFIEVPQSTPFNTTLVTVSAWVKTTQAPGYYKSVVGIAHASDGFSWGLLIDNGQPSIYTGFEARGAAINDGNWHHLVGVIGTTSYDLYVDGQLVQTTPGGQVGSAATGLLQIGRFRNAAGNFSDNYYEGDIDDVVIYNRALNATEIAHIHEPCVTTTYNNPQSVCAGGSYTFNGHTYSTAGTYNDTLQTVNGCDSVIVTQLTVKPNASSSFSQSICAGESYFFNGANRTTAGTYKDTLASANGCDSIITLTLTVKANASSTQTMSACVAYEFNGTMLYASGMYYDTLTSAAGCDSIVTLNLTIFPLTTPAIVNHGDTLSTVPQDYVSYQWYLNDDQINGAEDEIYIASEDGEYVVYTVDENGCDAFSSIFVYTHTGIDEVLSDKINVYPNPVSTVLQFSENVDAKLFSITGQLVMAVENVTGINVAEIPAGVYSLLLTDQKGQFIQRNKIVKE